MSWKENDKESKSGRLRKTWEQTVLMRDDNDINNANNMGKV